MQIAEYLRLKSTLVKRGYKKDITWCENIKPPNTDGQFLSEYIHVVINSGMKNDIANKIFRKVAVAIIEDKDISTVYGHAGKVKAIKSVMADNFRIWKRYMAAKE